jgi:hypothetical protein
MNATIGFPVTDTGRKKDIRTVRKEMKAEGFVNIKFDTWGQSHETFGSFDPEKYKEFLDGDNKVKCDWVRKHIFTITGGYDVDDLVSLEIDGIELINWYQQKWIDGKPIDFNIVQHRLKWK